MQRFRVKAVALLVLVLFSTTGCMKNAGKELGGSLNAALTTLTYELEQYRTNPDNGIGPWINKITKELKYIQKSFTRDVRKMTREERKELERLIKDVAQGLGDRLNDITRERTREAIRAFKDEGEAYRDFLKDEGEAYRDFLERFLPSLMDNLVGKLAQGAGDTVQKFFNRATTEMFPAGLVVFGLLLLPLLYFWLIRAELIPSPKERRNAETFADEFFQTVNVVTRVSIRWGVSAVAIIISIIIARLVLDMFSSLECYRSTECYPTLRVADAEVPEKPPQEEGPLPLSPLDRPTPPAEPDAPPEGDSPGDGPLPRLSTLRRERAFFCPQLKTMVPSGSGQAAKILTESIRACTGPTPVPLHEEIRSVLTTRQTVLDSIRDPEGYPIFDAFSPGPYTPFDPILQRELKAAEEKLRRVEFYGHEFYGKPKPNGGHSKDYVRLDRRGYPDIDCGVWQQFRGSLRFVQCVDFWS